jgi:protein-S-isoprenylcysteine O-methyltransferase Ste14
MLRRSAILLAHLLFALAPIAIGWGLSDLPQFFADPARAALVAAICAGAAAVLILGIDLDPLRSAAATTSKESWTLAAMATASILLLAFLPYADRHHLLQIPSEAVRWFGLLLCCAGGVIRILALRQLGPQFSAYVTLQPDHQLVQSGIYSRIRHPLYLSLLLAGPGVALVLASQLVWPILIVTSAFIANRIKVEETLLAKTFPDSFLVYRDRTSALLPFVF